MNNTVFVNEAMDYALNMYRDHMGMPYSEIFNSFSVVVIRTLCVIYKEENILIPFVNGNQTTFVENLKVYGYSGVKLNKFFQDMQRFYEFMRTYQEGNKIPEFIFIQEDLIDMMITRMKKERVSEEVQKQFEKFLYTNNNPNPNYRNLNIKHALDTKRVEKYWNIEKYRKDHRITFVGEKKKMLNPQIYQEEGIALEKILNMSQDDIDRTNTDIFAKYKVDAGSASITEDLMSAIEKNKNRDVVSSGSGFVDKLILVAVISTVVSIGFVVALIFWG